MEVQTSYLAGNYNIHRGITQGSDLCVQFVYYFWGDNLKWSKATCPEQYLKNRRSLIQTLSLCQRWHGKKCYVWRTYRGQTDVMVSWAEIKIACLVSQLTMTKIVSNLKDDGIFSIKSMEMEFYSYSGIGSCLRDL